jgi:hypothetical protein
MESIPPCFVVYQRISSNLSAPTHNRIKVGSDFDTRRNGCCIDRIELHLRGLTSSRIAVLTSPSISTSEKDG